ncbi:SpoIIE family protein phosphatase [Fulvivirga sp. 29W222]|uniref:SpoIIE family protein phosphatase n=1 Tax=Fulvivirga marina TaxID=2494733 RepID=A0A937KDE7_9BACT|nr:SpoIIE family protein phosphatase [Fulvivirga marina]MBL6448532.1 SpoIIE family protein phosphatase [Fulvivirga marina]
MLRILFFFNLVFLLLSYSAQLNAQTNEDLEAALKNKNYPLAVDLYYKMGSDAWKRGDTKNSEELFQKGIRLSEDNKLSGQLQYGWYSLGLIQYNSNAYNDAIKSFEESLEYAKSNNDQESMARCQLYVGKSYFLRGRNRRSVNALEEALNIALKIKDLDLQKECYSWLSKSHKAMGNEEKAVQYDNSFTLINRDIERKTELSTMEEKISSVEKELESQEQTLESQEQTLESQLQALKSQEQTLKSKEQTLEKVSDSLKEIAKITKEQQLKIDLLNVEKELTDVTLKAKEAELENNKLIRNSLIFGLLLVGLLGAAIYKGYKDKMKASEEIHKKQMDIESSINYGLRIQQAMLPSKEKFEQLLPQSFVLFKPRNVVSGDFYWINELYNEKIAVAAVDCTGHGVPGAFMSMIGSNALDSIVNTYVDEPDKILHELHRRVLNALKQEETGNKDGMDMALCVIDTDRDQLYFSGAKNHLIYIKEGEVFQIRGDKHPIGGIRKVPASFTQHTIDLEGEMYFYMYSDGFVDQFGGPDNMKFMSKKFKTLIEKIHLLPMEEQKARLDEALATWKGDNKQTDDVLVIGFKLTV